LPVEALSDTIIVSVCNLAHPCWVRFFSFQSAAETPKNGLKIPGKALIY